MLRCPVSLFVFLLSVLLPVFWTPTPAMSEQSQPRQKAEEKESPPPSPFTLQQLEYLIQNSVSSLDILEECKLRGLAFIPKQEVVDQLKQVGADPHFLNEFSQYSMDATLVQLREELGKALKTQDWEQVISIANKLEVFTPRWNDLYLIRANAKSKLGHFKDAIQDLQIFARYNIGNDGVWLAVGRLALNSQNLDQADFVLTRVLETSPVPVGEVSLLRGQVRQGQTRYREAMQDYRISMTLTPREPEPYGRLAFLLASVPNEELRDIPAATTLSEAATRLLKSAKEPTPECQIMVHLASAAVAARLEKYDDAAAAVRKAIAVEDRPEFNRYLDGLNRREPINLLREDIRRSTLDNLIVALHNDMISLPAGTDTKKDESEIRPFLISRHEVTQQEWAAVMGEFPPANPDLPMDFVSYHEVQEFLDRLNRRIGHNVTAFRLPTEQEWEYATRADVEGEWFFGNNASTLSDFAWYVANSDHQIHPVATKKPNSFGLYDVYGNVAELCVPSAEFSSSSTATGSSVASDPGTHDWVIARGGNFTMTDSLCRSSSSMRLPKGERLRGVGFRLAASTLPELKIHVERITQPPEGFSRAIDDLKRQYAAATSTNVKVELNQRLMVLLYVKAVTDLEGKQYQEALNSLNQILQVAHSANDPFAIISRINLAWIYATCESPEIRNPTEAFHQANQALGLLFIHNTSHRPTWEVYSAMAAAHAELGDFDKAVQREKQAIPLAPEGRKEELLTRLKTYEKKTPIRSGTLLISPFDR